jgi:protein ImuB
LVRIEDIETATAQLADELCVLLARYHKGARQLELALFRVDGEVTVLRAGTSAPSRVAAHLARLFREKLQQAGDDFDAGFGIEAMNLAALAVDPLMQAQAAMTDGAAADRDIDGLMDRLGNRLGPARVMRLQARASHVPERAVRGVAVLRGDKPVAVNDWRVSALQHGEGAVARPLRMLAAPEPIEVTAEIPEGPPRRFRWRRVLYHIARAEGPERIAPEWWRNTQDRTRDYYRVEDTDGHRFWLFRDGLYLRDTETPRWFIQGMFG